MNGISDVLGGSGGGADMSLLDDGAFDRLFTETF